MCSSCRMLIALSLLAVCAACARGEVEERKPDVILVTIDALRADSLSFAGNPHVESLNLDRFAANGIVFSEAISSFYGTTAPMPSLMTGLYPSFEGVEKWNAATQYGFSDLNDPESEISRFITEHKMHRKKVEAGTKPMVFYYDG